MDYDGQLADYASQVEDLREELALSTSGMLALTLELEESKDELARQSDQLRLANAKLEAANAELNAFSYSVSHDLRAPLRAVLGFSRVLKDSYGEVLDADGIQLLDRVQQSAGRMSDLIIDLLQLSRTTTADMSISVVDLSRLVEDVVNTLRDADPGRIVQVDVRKGMTCRADARLLRVLFENLIGNAWKFTSGRDNALIEVSVGSRDDSRVFYFVRDNGAGFDMSYASKLFAPFQRLHTEEEFPGTGIGLATVRTIVRRHGGEVWADGEPGKGAAFYFTLAPSQADAIRSG